MLHVMWQKISLQQVLQIVVKFNFLMAIGVAEPTSIMVETFGTGKVSNEVLVKLVREFFDLRPYGLIKMLNLIQPIYRQTAAYGHFGREQFPWEKVDRAEELRAAAGLK